MHRYSTHLLYCCTCTCICWLWMELYFFQRSSVKRTDICSYICWIHSKHPVMEYIKNGGLNIFYIANIQMFVRKNLITKLYLLSKILWKLFSVKCFFLQVIFSRTCANPKMWYKYRKAPEHIPLFYHKSFQF